MEAATGLFVVSFCVTVRPTTLRFRLEKWFWVAMILPTVLWLRESVVWVALLSIYALVITAAGAEQSAEATAKAEGSHGARGRKTN
jgi:hypothetical protein